MADGSHLHANLHGPPWVDWRRPVNNAEERVVAANLIRLFVPHITSGDLDTAVTSLLGRIHSTDSGSGRPITLTMGTAYLAQALVPQAVAQTAAVTTPTVFNVYGPGSLQHLSPAQLAQLFITSGFDLRLLEHIRESVPLAWRDAYGRNELVNALTVSYASSLISSSASSTLLSPVFTDTTNLSVIFPAHQTPGGLFSNRTTDINGDPVGYLYHPAAGANPAGFRDHRSTYLFEPTDTTIVNGQRVWADGTDGPRLVPPRDGGLMGIDERGNYRYRFRRPDGGEMEWSGWVNPTILNPFPTQEEVDASVAAANAAEALREQERAERHAPLLRELFTNWDNLSVQRRRELYEGLGLPLDRFDADRAEIARRLGLNDPSRLQRLNEFLGAGTLEWSNDQLTIRGLAPIPLDATAAEPSPLQEAEARRFFESLDDIIVRREGPKTDEERAQLEAAARQQRLDQELIERVRRELWERERREAKPEELPEIRPPEVEADIQRRERLRLEEQRRENYPEPDPTAEDGHLAREHEARAAAARRRDTMRRMFDVLRRRHNTGARPEDERGRFEGVPMSSLPTTDSAVALVAHAPLERLPGSRDYAALLGRVDLAPGISLTSLAVGGADSVGAAAASLAASGQQGQSALLQTDDVGAGAPTRLEAPRLSA